ncbi:hypothetical protein Cantr_00944 [Candida viswanathii]|uniref:BHLH domain-containing protein n=1 Tax=Candida viswanathii TaxID=5486 RepID=A0A367YHW0_9ASCO|nr:hypothetical protein Cantr_00944 [Candida viswanathii]
MVQNNLNPDLNDDNNNNHQRFPLDFDFGLAPPTYLQNNTGSPDGTPQNNTEGKYNLANGSGNYQNFEYELPTNTEFIAEIAAFDGNKEKSIAASAQDSTSSMNNNNGSHTGTNTHNNGTPNLDHFSRFNAFDGNLEDSMMLEEDSGSPMVFNLNNQDSFSNNLPPNHAQHPSLQSQSAGLQQQQHMSNSHTPLFQGQNTPLIAQVQQRSSLQQLRVGSGQELNSMGTPLTSPLSIDTNNFNPSRSTTNNSKESSVLDYQNSKMLTEQASKITFGNGQALQRPPTVSSSANGLVTMNDNGTITESPPVSPLNTNNAPKLKTTKAKLSKGRKSKLENQLSNGSTNNNSSENINSINHNPHPGRPRIKSAHNVIEQRYRNKINDKFNALQNSVPTLRILAKKKEREKYMAQQHNTNSSNHDSNSNNEDYDSSDDEMLDNKSSIMNGTPNNSTASNGVLPTASMDEEIDLEGLEPARKLNKGTILAKSIEYIKFLELKNDRMKQEHDELVLKARMLGLVIDDEQM